VVCITDKTDPRPARSRARLLEAATALLRTGGPSAVTVDAVTRGANVARATLYRHFPSGNDLLAAAFNGLIPPAPMPSEHGTLRDRLIAGDITAAQTIGLDPKLFLHRPPDVSDASVEAYLRPMVEKAAFALSTNEAWALLACVALIGLLLVPLAGPPPKRD